MYIAQYPFITKNMLGWPFFKKDDSLRAVNHSDCYSTINARSALKIGIECLGLKEGDEILLPAYHCPVMVYPILESGLVPVFYKIEPNCTTDISDIKAKTTSKTKALILVHYFGFPNDIVPVQKYCRENNLCLIEDCAHTFFGKIGKFPIGSFGDMAIMSLWKFLPVCHGGFLIINNKKIANRVHFKHAPLPFQIKSGINTLEMGDLPYLVNKCLRIKDKVWLKVKSKNEEPSEMHSIIHEKKENPYSLDKVKDTYTNWKAPWFSNLIYQISDQKKIIEQRVSNFKILEQAVSQFNGIKSLFKAPLTNVVPYNYPVIIENSDEIVKKLRKKSVNISRFGNISWDGIDINICEVSSYYSKHCIQLPVHQSLTKTDMRQMVNIIDACL